MTIEDLKRHNYEVFMEQGPRLSTRYRTWVEARDRSRGMVLVGGLGGLGVGYMWFKEEPHHSEYEGYKEATEVEYNGSLF